MAQVESRPPGSLFHPESFPPGTPWQGHHAGKALALYADLDAERESQAEQICGRFFRLVLKLWAAYAEAKRAEGVLDNDDLQSEAVALLERAANVRPPGPAFRLSERFQRDGG